MRMRALIALAALTLAATACISIETPAVNYGTGARFVPFVIDSIDDMGQGGSVALTSDGLPYVSYFGFAAKLEKGEIATPRPFGSPNVPGAMLSTASSDGLWQRGAVEMEAPASATLDPQGVTVPFGPVKTENLDLTTDNTNGTSVGVDASGTVDVAWAAGNAVRFATTKLGGTSTVDTVFSLPGKVSQAGPIGRPSVAIASDGSAWVAFTVETAKGLEVHAAQQQGSKWNDQIVASFPSCNGCPAPQPTGIGVVGSAPVVVYADPASEQVHAATLQKGKWNDAVVADHVSGFGLSFAVGDKGAYAAYYTGSGSVEEATLSGVTWKTTKVADAADPDTTLAGAPAANTAVTATSDGTVYVAWEDAGIHLSSGTDSFSPVDVGTSVNTGEDPALATSNNGVALAWYDTIAQNQMFGVLGEPTDVIVAQPSPSLTLSIAPPSPTAACGKDKTVALDETALGIAFQQTCLVAAADQPFTINFDNQDAGTQHNIAIFTDSSLKKNWFTGDVITGVAKIPYDVDALNPGSYYFHCDIHPTTMTGTLAVVAGAK
jgi:plastocyanin